jgi:hypothetical protein
MFFQKSCIFKQDYGKRFGVFLLEGAKHFLDKGPCLPVVIIDNPKDVSSVIEVGKQNVFFLAMMQPIGVATDEVDTIFNHMTLCGRSQVQVFGQDRYQRQPALDEFVFIDKHLKGDGVGFFF